VISQEYPCDIPFPFFLGEQKCRRKPINTLKINAQGSQSFGATSDKVRSEWPGQSLSYKNIIPFRWRVLLKGGATSVFPSSSAPPPPPSFPLPSFNLLLSLPLNTSPGPGTASPPATSFHWANSLMQWPCGNRIVHEMAQMSSQEFFVPSAEWYYVTLKQQKTASSRVPLQRSVVLRWLWPDQEGKKAKCEAAGWNKTMPWY
jgi:hypothetical protein